MSQPPRPRRRVRLGVVLATALACLLVGAAPSGAAVPVGDLASGVAATLVSPRVVPGANDWSCRPDRAHPRPVVLVHGTLEAPALNWAALGPVLKNEGYCVFALTYGENALSLDGRLPGLADIAASAAELGAFVERVRAATGSAKVDLVGHSQGGMMPHYYIERLGGADKVDQLVALAPSNHGTTLSGLTELGEALHLLGVANSVLGLLAPAAVQQEVGSDFQTSLFGDGDTVPGPDYTVIETSRDLVVTPYTNAFLEGPGVENILIQDQCPDDPVGHVGLSFDQPAIQNVLNELGPDSPGFRATCTGYGIGI
ncbi:MAG TPA: alpha/beta fold hydrolase [Acidimicrobiales bacterium]|nr:alpha/beta fold hydrolase [Acidimicrobiales bacterium]